MPPYRALRTADELYVEHETGERELYDLRADPHEVRNLAASPGHQAVLRQMRQRLVDWERDTGGPGARPQGASDAPVGPAPTPRP